VQFPSWIYKLGLIGGFGFLYQNLIKPMFLHFRKKYLQRHDEPIWQVLITPNMKLDHWTGDKACYSRTEEIPYPMQDIADKTNRSVPSVRASLQRFKERGEAKEKPNGWQRT
jgi:hypothetical protein